MDNPVTRASYDTVNYVKETRATDQAKLGLGTIAPMPLTNVRELPDLLLPLFAESPSPAKGAKWKPQDQNTGGRASGGRGAGDNDSGVAASVRSSRECGRGSSGDGNATAAVAAAAEAAVGAAGVGLVSSAMTKKRLRPHPAPTRSPCTAPAGSMSAKGLACLQRGELRMGCRRFLETARREQCGGWWRTHSIVKGIFYAIEMCLFLGLFHLRVKRLVLCWCCRMFIGAPVIWKGSSRRASGSLQARRRELLLLRWGKNRG